MTITTASLTPMPTLPEYMALAEAMHGEDDSCIEGMAAFSDCAWREWDIGQAVKVLVALRKEGWRMVRDVNATEELGL